MLLLIAFPLKEIGVFHFRPLSISLPQEVHHGSTITWPENSKIAKVFFDGLPPSVNILGEHFGVVGLYEANSVLISGVWQPQKRKKSFLTNPSHEYFIHNIPVSRPFKNVKAPKLRLPSSVWKKVSKVSEERELYRQQIKKIRKNHSGEFTKSCWNAPLKSKINSPFGKPRYLPNGRRYFHSGVDLRARTGTPLRAIAGGKVVYAKETVVPGKTVVLYHGDGVHSQYMHMDQIDVEKGQFVEQGELIGATGATGRVEGPHLHWEIYWKGRKANPFEFVEKMQAPHCPPQNI